MTLEIELLKDEQLKRPQFLTNAMCESTSDKVDLFNLLGLTYGSFENEFYPLTDDEAKFIAEDVFELDNGKVLFGYSILYKNRKWIAPCVEAQIGTYLPHTVLEGIEKAGGIYFCLHHDKSFEVTHMMLFPFYFVEQFGDFKVWKLWIEDLFLSALHPATDDVSNELPKDLFRWRVRIPAEIVVDVMSGNIDEILIARLACAKIQISVNEYTGFDLPQIGKHAIVYPNEDLLLRTDIGNSKKRLRRQAYEIKNKIDDQEIEIG